MSRARDNANLGAQAGSGLDASDITTGVLPSGVTGGSGLNALSASNLSAGTVPDARFPATLPAASGTNLTALPAANLTGVVADARMPNLTGAITTVEGAVATTIADDAITGGKLANDIAISTTGAITTTGAFTSVGIDDNASGATAITIDDDERVGIGPAPPSDMLDGYTNIAFGGNSTMQTNNSATTGASFYISQNAYRDNVPNWRRISETDEASQYVQNNGTHKFKYVAAGTIASAITWLEGMEIGATGDVTVATGNLVIGTAGKGITFSSTNTPAKIAGSGASNTLHDYEEGTWVPSFGMTGGSVGYGTREGSYTCVGNLVSVTGAFSISSISSPSGVLTLQGFPFTNGSGEKHVSAVNVALFRDSSTNYTSVKGYIQNGGAVATLGVGGTNQSHVNPDANILQVGTLFYFTLTYLRST